MNSSASQKISQAFTLLEVVLATALVAGAISAVLAMLPPVLAAMADAGSRSTALRVAQAIDARWANESFATVVGEIDSIEPIFADRTGTTLGTAESSVWTDLESRGGYANGSKRFELAAVRDEALSNSAVVVYTLIVRWPAYTGAGRRVTDGSQQVVLVLKGARAR